MGEVLILAGSHRAGGNSDHAAGAVLRGVEDAGGQGRIMAVRDLRVEHCLACGHCHKDPESRCVLRRKDDVESVFSAMLEARAVVVASPVYFYHLPSRLKTLMDRGQSMWEAWEKKAPMLMERQRVPAYCLLVAGQSGGQRHFDCSCASLKIFFNNFKMELGPCLEVRGKDGPGDLASDPQAVAAARALGRQAWTRAGQ